MTEPYQGIRSPNSGVFYSEFAHSYTTQTVKGMPIQGMLASNSSCINGEQVLRVDESNVNSEDLRNKKERFNDNPDFAGDLDGKISYDLDDDPSLKSKINSESNYHNK